MIHIDDIISAINQMLNDNFDESVYSSDKERNIDEPCFIVRYNFDRDGRKDFAHDYGQVRIYYFPAERNFNRLELLEKQKELTDLFFNDIKTDNIFIPISELDFELDNDVLVLNIDIELYQEIKETGLDMEEIELS